MEVICWKIDKFVLDSISENMAALIQTDKYGNINTTFTTTIATMWLNSCQNPTYYKKEQRAMEKSVLMVN